MERRYHKYCNKLRSLLYRFKKLNKNHLKIIYIHIKSKYGIIDWGGANKTNINPLIIIQKLYLKTLYGITYLNSTELLYKESKLLNIRKLYSQCLLIHQHKIYSEKDLVEHIYNTRNKDKNLLKVKVARKTIRTKCFIYLGPRLYIKLPENIKQTKTATKYKREVRKWLLSIKYTEIDIFVDTGYR